MTTGQMLDVGQSPSRAQRRRLLLRTLFRCLVSAAVLVALYYVLPLQDLRGHPVWVSLSAGLVVLVGVGVQVFRGAVQVARQHSRPVAPGKPEDEQSDGKGMPEQVEGRQP